MKNVLLLYSYQLYEVENLPSDVDQILVVEDPLLFGRDEQYPMYIHKQKLVFMRASMRRYVEEKLWPAGFDVEYVEFHQMKESGDIVNKLSHFEEVVHFDFTDDVLCRRVQTAIEGLKNTPQITRLESPNFYLQANEVENALSNKRQNFIEFYQWQRERFNILINPETYKPIGGKLSFETENKKRLPKDHHLPTFQVFGSNKYADEAKEYVQKHFPENPGSFDDFPWPTNHEEAEKWLDEFLENRIDDFGPYQEAIDGEAPWQYHSGISPLLNAGLLTPHKVIKKAIDRNEQKPVPIASLEAFVRQILGWREYVRGMYLMQHVQLRTANTFGHNRSLTEDWYRGTTGIPPIDEVIKKTLTRGYAHNVERFMIIGNFMFICDIHPSEVYRWFMEMYVDAYDWVMVPNVYGVSQYSDVSNMIPKPTVTSSNYILKMSHYERGNWSDVWDGLYWRFIEKNKLHFAKNPKMSVVLSQLEKLDENRKRIISYRAEDFLKEKTAL